MKPEFVDVPRLTRPILTDIRFGGRSVGCILSGASTEYRWVRFSVGPRMAELGFRDVRLSRVFETEGEARIYVMKNWSKLVRRFDLAAETPDRPKPEESNDVKFHTD